MVSGLLVPWSPIPDLSRPAQMIPTGLLGPGGDDIEFVAAHSFLQHFFIVAELGSGDHVDDLPVATGNIAFFAGGDGKGGDDLLFVEDGEDAQIGIDL